MKIQQQVSRHYLGDLDTPVEQPLWTELVLDVPDVLQQGPVSVELGDDLQTVSRTDAQDPYDVGVVQAAQGHHVLHRRRSVNMKVSVPDFTVNFSIINIHQKISTF